MDVVRRGTPAQAFGIICNAANNPPLQEPGVLNLDLMLAMTRPGEFTVLQVRLAAAGEAPSSASAPA